VLRNFIETRIILTPLSNAIHWLATALSGALLVGLSKWASISIVGSNRANSVDSASSVLVVIGIMIASAIRTPVTSTVHWLAATVGGTLNLVVLKWTLDSTQVSLGGDLVGPATLVPVTVPDMSTRSI
jgi:hypothetical protein